MIFLAPFAKSRMLLYLGLVHLGYISLGPFFRCGVIFEGSCLSHAVKTLQLLLLVVCKLYSEQRAIRVRRVVEKKGM